MATTKKEQEARDLNFRERVIALQNELHAPKSRFNSFANYAYRSCEDILEAVKPLCLKHGLLLHISDSIELVGDRYYVKAVATLQDAVSDEKIESVGWAREGDPKKGLESSQQTGLTSSYCRKYCLNALLLCDDTKDADTDEYAKQTGRKEDYMATISKFQHITDLEIWWKSNLDELKTLPNYKEIFAYASQKGKELNEGGM